jgi:hypothetical protein
MLSVVFAECHTQALYAECHYAECRYAEGRGTTSTPTANFADAADSFPIAEKKFFWSNCFILTFFKDKPELGSEPGLF